ncbi:MAG: septum formation inhibitor Maf [Methylotenera sp.]|nr:Maf family protein [Methylotenera sp.]PPC87055.1 MAG: septum formation inhibitor Maf [Methylotenera sp.]PPD17503.1 MAG: septum formation inhibitor Maf [Methylotenera sp.]
MQINLQKVILASQSPRRGALLKQMGIDCVVMPADIDESQLANESPTDYVLRLAKQKAQAIQRQLTGRDAEMPILAADTTVALGNIIFGKPENDADAMQMLKKLSGTQHQVHTAVAVVFNQQIELALSTTLVEMMPLSDAMIAAYIATNEHADKAGSYAIQGLAGNWIKRIDGSYTGVMGLPVHETALLLKKLGF